MNTLRIVLLVAIGLGLSGVTASSITQPIATVPTYTNFSFPDSIPLDEWSPVSPSSDNVTNGNITEEITNRVLADHEVNYQDAGSLVGETLSQQRYQYQQGQALLTINIRYLIETNSDLKSIIPAQARQSQVKRSPEHGFYYLFEYDGNAYLTTCQSQRGPTTVTADQFSRSRMRHDAAASRLLPWLQGKSTLGDQRCLWTQMSVSLENYGSRSALAYEAMETAWHEWTNWWTVNFPEA
ncbi:MAG: cyanoexosortase A system-associated protein [Cyanobacteria bacterium J06643_4]